SFAELPSQNSQETEVVPYPVTATFEAIYIGPQNYFTTDYFPPGEFLFRASALNAIKMGPYSITVAWTVTDPLAEEISIKEQSAQNRLSKRIKARNELQNILEALNDVSGKINKNLPVTEKLFLLTNTVARAKKYQVQDLDAQLMEK